MSDRSRVQSFTAKLTRVRDLSSTTRDFRFVSEDGVPLEFEPGQFFRFTFTDDKGEFERSYSLCNFEADVTPSDLDLVVSTVAGGRASKLLFESGAGLEAKVSGPFGRLVLPDELPQRLFLVATSVGIAPFMPMLAALAGRFKNGDSCEVHFLSGTRDYEEFIYGDELIAFAARFPQFHLHLCLSRCDVVDDKAPSQIRGYVQAQLMALEPNPETDHVLLCGNPKMIDDAYAQLKEVGFKVKQVVREKYVFAKEKKAVSADLSDEQKALIAAKMAKFKKS